MRLENAVLIMGRYIYAHIYVYVTVVVFFLSDIHNHIHTKSYLLLSLFTNT